jgi:alkylation response protein AidB-like acyl-CoA dehydrogenase
VTQKFIWDRETTAAETPQMSAFGTNMLAPVLYTWGTAEQQAQHLPPIREARRIWCQGYSEPGAGSDLAKISTRAQRRDGHYLVTGEKTWTSGAHLADWMFCLVRTDPAAAKPQAGISFLLIDMRSAGVEVRPITTLGGQHTVNSVRLNDVLVPLANRIGEENSGWTYAKNLLTHERTGVARVGMSKVQLSRLKTLARNTEEDGVSLWSDAGFRAKVHALEIDLMGLEILELRTLANLSSGAAPGPESSILKLAGSEIGQRIVQLQVETFGYYALPYPDQILLDNEGPIGDEYAVPAMQGMLFSRAWSVYGGANEIQKNIIAKSVLGLS